jgi:hypothetical protein
MKRVILILIMICPVAAIAQEQDSSGISELTGAAGSLAKEASGPRDDESVSIRANRHASTWLALGQPWNAALPQRPKRAQPSKVSPEIRRLRTSGSMVGYIDDAIVASEVRIRFQAGFGDDTPDRAEFFYAKSGFYGFLLPTNPAFDPSAPGPGPGTVTNLNFQQLYVNIEYALNQRFSVFAEPSLRSIQVLSGSSNFPTQAGFGDVRAGFKLAMLASPDRYLTLQFRTYFPTGNASQGLGTNHYSVEPALLYYQRFSKRLSLESEAGDWIPTGGSAGVASLSDPHPGRFSGNVFFYGVGPSYELYSSDHVRFTPVVELVGWHLLSGFETTPNPAEAIGIKAGGTNIFNLKIGARTAFSPRSSVYVGYGHALTSADWYNSILTVEYRYEL